MKKNLLWIIIAISLGTLAIVPLSYIAYNQTVVQPQEETKQIQEDLKKGYSKYYLDCYHIMTGTQVCSDLNPILSDIDKRLSDLENKTK